MKRLLIIIPLTLIFCTSIVSIGYAQATSPQGTQEQSTTGPIYKASLTEDEIVNILGNDDQGNPKPHNFTTVKLNLSSFMLRYGDTDTRDPSTRECSLGKVFDSNNTNLILGDCTASPRQEQDENVCKSYTCEYGNADPNNTDSPKVFTATFDISQTILNAASLSNIFADPTLSVDLTFRVNIEMDRDSTTPSALYKDNVIKTYNSATEITETTNKSSPYCDIGVNLSKLVAEITTVQCKYEDGSISVTNGSEFVEIMTNPKSLN